MELNGPGTSIFQGNELKNFDNLEQREEEEDLEEQRIRDLELKNELENAFDDVSLDNDEDSVYIGNRSSSSHSTNENILRHEVEPCFFKEIAQNGKIKENSTTNGPIGGFNSPLKQSLKNNLGKKVEFSNDCDNYSDECRKKIQNGSLHDIVDQSGGGDRNLPSLLHYNHCFQRSPLGDGICNGLTNNITNTKNHNFTDEAEDSSEQLKILYEVRVREVHRLTEMIDSMRNEHEIQLNDLKHQLALVMAEKERSNISQTQLQNLLVDYKQQVDHLANDMNTLEKVKKDLENTNKELVLEFETAKLTIDDLQRKVLVLEKGQKSKSEAEQYELNIKCLTEKHNTEMMNLKKELDSYVRNCEKLIKENEELKLKVINLSQINDENLAKKSEIISRLSQQVEDTQKQLENLMKSSTAEDNFRLQAEVNILKEEKLQLTSRIEHLEKERSRQEEEIKQYESLNKMCFFNSNNSIDIKDLEGSEISGKLGAELYRSLSSQKAKRLEIKNLELQLNEKNEQIESLLDNEKSLKREILSLKEDIKENLSKLKEKESDMYRKEKNLLELQKTVNELQERLKDNESSKKCKCQELEKENENLKHQISNLEKEKEETMNNYNKEYLRFHNEGLEKVREETENQFKLELVKRDLENENLKKELDEIKNLYVDMCNAKENSLSHKEKNGSERGSIVDLEEVKKLQKELEKSRHRILELDQTLKQQYEQEVDILNLDINQLKLQLEKLKKEKARDLAEKDKISVENELLKSEIEQVTSEKNLLFLNYEKLLKEREELCETLEKLKETSKSELKKVLEKHSLELQNLSNKYEINIKKLKKEIELTVTKSVSCESKYTSPMKNTVKNAETQGCSYTVVDKATSPLANTQSMNDKLKETTSKFLKDISVLTDPEPVKIPKAEVVEIMKQLGAHHEQEILSLEKKYTTELIKLEKKFHEELDKAKEVIFRELHKEHQLELEELEEKHRMEMENRIEHEKKEAVMDLITEWACEVQSLKTSYAESQAEMEKLKLKYKAAKSVALQYKTYFKNKAEHMKEEWKKIEDSYELALKELEKNVHILVDVKEDEVNAKVDSITKLYEQKISKMKEKLVKCENKLKAEKESNSNKQKTDSKSEVKKDLERLSVPKGNLYPKLSLTQRRHGDDLSPFRKFLNDDDESGVCLKQEYEGEKSSKTPKKPTKSYTSKERTKR